MEKSKSFDLSIVHCNQQQSSASSAAMLISIKNNLILTKKYPIKYFNFEPEVNRTLSLGPGVTITNDSILFNCLYPLDNIHAVQNYNSISNETIYRTNIGHLDYKIKFSRSHFKLGEKVRFEIIPTNPGLVFSRLKFCTVRPNNTSELKYDLYWPVRNQFDSDKYCKDKITNF